MIRVVCTCGRAFKTEDRHAGKQTTCPECGAGLRIGPAPTAGSGGGSGDEPPAWWHGGDPASPAAHRPAPTRSSSDPGIVAAPPKAPAPGGAAAPAPGGRPATAGMPWAIAGGAVAILCLAVGAFVWLRPGNPGDHVGAPAPRGAEQGRPDGPGEGQPPAPSAAGLAQGSSGERTARSPASDAGAGASTPSTKGDAAASRGATPVAARGLKLIVPAYIYPSGDGRKEWLRLIEAASKAEIVVIANPNSGPGEDRNLDYDTIITEADRRGVRVVGYVSTNYGNRPREDIKKDVDTWVGFYPRIRGFFFDQQPREDQYVPQFAELREYARGKLKDPLVITNPGIPCDESYLARKVSDVTCIFQNYQGFDRFELPASFKVYEPSRFAVMPYGVADADTMRAFVKKVILKGIGYLYVSDAKPPNSWGKLPAYWEEEVDVVSRYR